MRQCPVFALVCGLVTLAGCASKNDAPIAPRSYDTEAMVKAAIQQFDKNGNGTLEASEFDSCPGMKAALAAFDTNNDSKVSAEELKARFEAYRAAGAVGYTIRVSLDGAPLTDATVTLTPEAFMGGAVGEATGKTGPDGAVRNYKVGREELPGLPSGVYRVAVTKDGVNIPAKYNAQTTLGCEVSAGGRGGSTGLDLKLVTK